MTLLEAQGNQDRLANSTDGRWRAGGSFANPGVRGRFVGSVKFVDSGRTGRRDESSPDLGISWNKVTVAITNISWKEQGRQSAADGAWPPRSVQDRLS